MSDSRKNQTARLRLALLLIVAMAGLLSGCSGAQGPSDKKITVDSKDLFQFTGLDIVDRKVLDEDRVQIQIHGNRGAHFTADRGQGWQVVRLRGKKDITVEYRHVSGDVWKLRRAWPTGRGRNPALEVSP